MPGTRTLPIARPIALPWALAVALAAATGPAAATDLVGAKAPQPLVDATLQVASRRLHLPPGHWTLVSRYTVETKGRKNHVGEGLEAWAVRVEDGRLLAVLHLSLPEEDFVNVHHVGGNGCEDDGEDGIARLDLSTSLKLPGCLAVYGQRELAGAIGVRSPATAAWLAAQHVAVPATGVRFAFKQRTDGAYGAVVLFVPTDHFESDADATAWAQRLREACSPLFEGRQDDATLPALPPPAATPPPGAASAP